jgi:hypothetical protein
LKENRQMKHVRGVGAALALVLVTTVGLSSLFGQSRQRTPQEQPQSEQGKEVTLAGKLVDLQSYMTGQYSTKDPVESTRRCIRAGVPAALETDDGLVIVGMGYRGPARELARHGMATVELKGRLYEKHGVKYIDVTLAKLAKSEKPEAEEEDEWEWPDEPQEPEEPEPEQP